MTQTAFENRCLFRQIRPGDHYVRLTWKFISGKYTWQEFFVNENYRTAESQADSFIYTMKPLIEFHMDKLTLPQEVPGV